MTILNNIAASVSPVFYTLLFLSLTAVIIGTVILVVRRITDKKISPSWKYLMWVCFIIALVVPFRFKSPVSLMNLPSLDSLQNTSYRAQFETTRTMPETFTTPAPTEQNPTPTTIVSPLKAQIAFKFGVFDMAIPLLWLAGLISMAFVFIIKYSLFARSIRSQHNRYDLSRYYVALHAQNVKVCAANNIRIEMSSAAKTPALFGLFRPKILLPEYINSISREALDCIMLHELCHCKRRDIAVNYLIILLQWIYWFNPLLRIFFKYIRQDLELANDSYALKFLAPANHRNYSLSLVEVAARNSKQSLAPSLLYMAENESNIERRIKMIKKSEKFKKNKLIIALGSLAIIAAIAILFLTRSTNSAPAQPISFALSPNSSDDFAVNSLDFKQLENEFEIILNVDSKIQSSCSLFDPPKGLKYMDAREDGIKKGNNIIKFRIDRDLAKELPGLSMKLNFENEDSFVYFETPQLFGETSPQSRPSSQATKHAPTLSKYSDVRKFAGFPSDLSDVIEITKDILISLTYNEGTIFPDKANMPTDLTPQELMEFGKNPGLGVRAIHESGITGKGINVAIIDQPLFDDHPEFKGKITKYRDFNTNSDNSMHGPAVTSLLVGENLGTAPGAKVYYAAVPSWLADAKYYADALDWIIEENEALPAGEKIRVVSVSAAPSGSGSPFTKTQNNHMWDESVAKANDAGILVLDCTATYGFISPAYLDVLDAENVEKMTIGFPNSEGLARATSIYAPTSRRTVAEHYTKDNPSFQYTGVGGLSWGIPYVAGVYAMGWQIHPEYTYSQMTAVLYETAHKRDNCNFINPPAFIAALQAK